MCVIAEMMNMVITHIIVKNADHHNRNACIQFSTAHRILSFAMKYHFFVTEVSQAAKFRIVFGQIHVALHHHLILITSAATRCEI